MAMSLPTCVEKRNESPPLNRRSFEDIKLLFYRFDIDRLLWFFSFAVEFVWDTQGDVLLEHDDNGDDDDMVMIILVLRYFDLIITDQNRARGKIKRYFRVMHVVCKNATIDGIQCLIIIHCPN